MPDCLEQIRVTVRKQEQPPRLPCANVERRCSAHWPRTISLRSRHERAGTRHGRVSLPIVEAAQAKRRGRLPPHVSEGASPRHHSGRGSRG
eukprot:6210805-Pleurochrysis_carterae.AAC.3